MSFAEAYARRLRRVYLPLLLVLLAAWVVRLTAFGSGAGAVAAAAVPGVSGRVVVLAVGCCYAAAILLAAWPRERRATGELREDDREGDWKTE
jgi:uncharacterized membrane protein